MIHDNYMLKPTPRRHVAAAARRRSVRLHGEHACTTGTPLRPDREVGIVEFVPSRWIAIEPEPGEMRAEQRMVHQDRARAEQGVFLATAHVRVCAMQLVKRCGDEQNRLQASSWRVEPGLEVAVARRVADEVCVPQQPEQPG